ncbi:hypothetical protein [Nocardia flavorosea]|uniref:hypothetical protein n=1 Tax=Nocardia flavorosea TaxID=53429 RepID=UPI002454BC65|nr:hypothetical protein [Nocardia flavorosea]
MRSRTTTQHGTALIRRWGAGSGGLAALVAEPEPIRKPISDSGGVLTVDPSARLQQEVTLAQLPAPPTAPSTEAGACTTEVNPRGTGCVDPGWGGLGSIGTYWPDSDHMLVGVNFTGAPATGPGAAYTGPQVLLVKTDGTTFTNGDGYKCLTCGHPAPTPPAGPHSDFGNSVALTYPINGFRDGSRALAGTNIIDCGEYRFADDQCTPDRLQIFPLEWDAGIGRAGILREPRLNPDDKHIGFSYMVAHDDRYEQIPFMGELVFDAAGERYTVENVRALHNPDPRYQPYVIDGNELRFNPAGMIGEFRGWTHDGTAALGIQHHQSGSIDAWATDNATGRSRVLTPFAGYTDPMAASPDGKYLLAEQVIGSGRVDFLAGIPGIPPIVEQLPTTGHVSGIRNNGKRRFFAPYLVDLESGKSLQVNAGGDPNWNAAADPAWLPDSTGVVWAENLVTAPACGRANPLPCPESGEPGGRRSRLMIAHFDNANPTAAQPVAPAPAATWGVEYHPGDPLPPRPHLPAGTYTMRGADQGSAEVVITENPDKTMITGISVTYTDYSDRDGIVVDGTESVHRKGDIGFEPLTWHSDLTISGTYTGTRRTSEPGGFTLLPATIRNDFEATGTMTTTLDGHTYTQPANGM